MENPPEATGSQHAVAPFDEFDENEAIVVEIEGEEIAVFYTGDSFHALHNTCPHQGGPLGKGKVKDGCVFCPWHGWQFDLESGSHVHGMAETTCYEVNVEEDVVYVTV